MSEEQPSAEAMKPKEAVFYEAFHDWFVHGGVDFWSECDAPESLATIAVELSERHAARAVAEERARCLAWAVNLQANWPSDEIIKAIKEGRPKP